MKNKKGQYTSKAKKRLERKIALAQTKQVWRIAVAVIILGIFPVMEIKDRLNKEYVFENTAVLVNTVKRVEEVKSSSAKPQDANGTMVAEKEAVRSASPTASISVIQKVAEKEGIDWKILYAICKKESNCNTNRIGDSGKSLGAFQIHTGYHPEISKEKATNLEWSAEWTAKRLKRYAYLGESEMIRSHNGLIANNANAYYVTDIYEIIKSL